MHLTYLVQSRKERKSKLTSRLVLLDNSTHVLGGLVFEVEGIVLKSVRNPSKQAAGGVLSERRPALASTNRCIEVRNCGGGKKNGRSRWELDDQSKVPEDQVPALRRVKVSQRRDRAPAIREVCVVSMRFGIDLGAEVEGGGGEDAVGEVSSKPGVFA